METQGGKRKHVDLDSTANKQLHLDLDASIESTKDVELDMKVSQFCFRVVITDHHTVVVSKTMALNLILCSVVDLLYRQKCVYYNYKSRRREPSLLLLWQDDMHRQIVATTEQKGGIGEFNVVSVVCSFDTGVGFGTLFGHQEGLD